ncbi:MAG: PorT family protein [Dysgonamonadaceae bacterium]|jgi:predicted porin|nr:PorT family protein [Dysgonamonadaceae bacterium]
MKKIFLTIAAVVAMAVCAQAQIKVGGTLGLNLANQVRSNGSQSETGDSKAGLKLGVLGEYQINDYLSAQAGLVFSQKGVASKESDSYPNYTLESEEKTTLNYLQIPINAVGRYKINDDITVSALAGPYLAFALSGKEVWESSGTVDGQPDPSVSESGDAKIKFGSDRNQWNGFDFGLTLGAGVEYKGVFLRLEYDWGLSNLLNDSGDISQKNRNFGISAGYFFSLK